MMRRGPIRNHDAVERALSEFVSTRASQSLPSPGPCPDDAQVAAFCRNQWAEDEVVDFRRHAMRCPVCVGRLVRLRHWGLPEELLLHPSEDLLRSYARDEISPGAAGDLLRNELAEHTDACETCRGKAAAVFLDSMQWTAVQAGVEQLGWLRRLATGLFMAAATQQEVARTRAVSWIERRKGAPRSGGEEITALVFDDAGRLVVDAEGQPATVQFTLLEARIDAERGLFIQVSLPPGPSGVPGPGAYAVRISLQHGSQRLTFPPVDLRPQDSTATRPGSMATLRADLGAAIEVQAIPVGALRLSVHPRGASSSDAS